MTLVKVCGITSLDDARAAVECGADILGFIFAKSPRHITPAQAEKIAEKLPPFTVKVGVFVNENPRLVLKLASAIGLSAAQLHGDERPEVLSNFYPLPVIKAFRIKDKSDLAFLPAYITASAFLLDAFVAGKRGGTGRTFDWKLAVSAKQIGNPVILSGGLTPENVSDAIRKVDPYCVDVNSGVESRPGKKDLRKLKKFISNCKRASR